MVSRAPGVSLAIASLLLLQLLVTCTHAYPMYFHSRGWSDACTDAPTSPVGGHSTPVADPSITVEVVLAGQPVTSLCPGQTYELTASFGSSSRAVLLSVSQGSLAEANIAGCPNAMTTSGIQRVQAAKANWVLPCTSSGTAEVKVTTGTAAIGSLRAASARMDINTACAASSCPRASPPPVTATTGGSSPSTTSTPAAPPPAPSTTSSTAADSPSTAAPSTLESGTPQQGSGTGATSTASNGLTVDTYTPANPSLMFPVAGTTADPTASTVALVNGAASCRPSSLGYQCSQQVADGVTLHYTYGGQGSQPGNSCTQGAGLNPALGNAADMMHLAIESSLPGYAAIGFPLQPGQMVPADAVIGSVDEASSAVQVDTYRLSSEQPTGINVVQPLWATGLGAVRTSTPSKVTIICFSRPLNTTATLLAALDPSAVPIIWAAHTSTSLQEQHAQQGSLTLNMLSGQSSAVAGDSDGFLPLHVRYAAQIAHGILMAAAFCVFMPAGVLAARHKWLFAHKETGRLSPTWFMLHQSLQHAAVTSTIASFVLAMALFFKKNGTGSLLHQLYTPHFGIGVAVPAMVVVQVLVAMLRPPLMHARRVAWRSMHGLWGSATLGLGIANCFVGVVLAHDLKRMSWSAWLVPMCLMLGLILLAGLSLEAAKIREQVQGRYDPATHTCHPRKRDDVATANGAGSQRDTPTPVSELEL